ncbi:MAG: helicase [Cohnella sp.]|nr:helicase [Cohnella sp.]
MTFMDEFLDMEPPCDLAAEQAIIGAVLLEAETIEIVREKMQGNEMFEPAHKKILRRMFALHESEKPIDLITLTTELSDNKELDSVGGVSYLSKLSTSVPTAANVTYYIDIVLEKYLLRQSIETGMEMMRHAIQSGDPRAVIASAEAAVSRLNDQAAPAREFSPISDVLMRVYENVENRFNNKDLYRGVTGIPSCFPDLDRLTSGFQNNDLIIVAARPSVGKTAFALNIAQNVAVKAGETVAVFSLEMSAAQLVERMICAESMVDAGRIRTGFLEGEDWENVTMAIGTLSEANVFIDDTPAITVSEIRAKCRRLKKEKGLGMILIDYIQLIAGRRRSGGNRQEEVAEISRTLKQVARELEVPVIALSQLSRGVEQRQDKRPMMSDLRESGAIEQDADIVAFLYRDDYYDKETEKKNIIEIIIAKQRNGPVGTVELIFMKNFNKFVSLDRGHAGGSPDPTLPPTGGKPIPDMHRGRAS